MRAGRRIVIVFLSVVAALLVLVLVAVLIVTNTDWGRERARRTAANQIQGAVNGQVEIGRIEGNLLRGARLIGVSVADSAGRPFVRADTLDVGYSIGDLLSRRISLTDIRLSNAVVVLDQPPGEAWNFVRIFSRPSEPEPARPSRWGQWIELRDLTLVNTSVTVRSEWEPPPDLNEAERAEAIREALTGETRANVIEAPGGYQNLMLFRQMNAELPRVVLAHPDTLGIPIDIARLSGLAQPFRPPAADIRQLAGALHFRGDTLSFQDVDAELPDSRLSVDGFYDLEHSELFLRLNGSPVALEDLRWLYPPLPEEGGGSLALDLRMRPGSMHLVARNADLRVRESEVRGHLDLFLGDTVRVQDANVQFSRLDTRLVESLVEDFEIPRHGYLGGHLALDGTPEAVKVDADILFDDEAGGTSRVLASGGIGFERQVAFDRLQLRLRPLQAGLIHSFSPDLPLRGTIEGDVTLSGAVGDLIRLDSDLTLRDPEAGVSRISATGGVDLRDELRLQDMALRFDPLQTAVVRAVQPEFPLGGVLQGTARVSGAPARHLTLNADLVHEGDGDQSHVIAQGELATGRTGPMDLEVELLPLSLGTAGQFVPGAGLRGSATGRLRLEGAFSDLSMTADVAFQDGGTLRGVARANLEDPAAGYDVDVRLSNFDLDAVSAHAPTSTSLSGAIRAEGRGFDPGTLRASIDVDLQGSAVAEYAADAVQFDASLENGMATIAPSHVRIGGALATFEGTLGLIPDRAGRLIYLIRIDSLETVAPMIAGFAVDESTRQEAEEDVARTEPQRQPEARTPAPQAERVITARPAVRRKAAQEVELAARQVEVELLATGSASSAPSRVDRLASRPIPRDSLAGRFETSGTLSGNLMRFDLDGRARFDRFLYQGNYVESGEIQYALEGVGTEGVDISLDASLQSLLIEGFAFDSATLEGTYRGRRYGTGAVELSVVQNESTDLFVDADFSVEPNRSELLVQGLEVRIDTIQWSTTRPATLSWRGAGLDLANLELESTSGGEILLHGQLPVDAPADLRLSINDLEIAQVTALLQAESEFAGLLSLEAEVAGTLQQPRVVGEAALRQVTVARGEVPDANATFEYADEELRAEANLTHEGTEVAFAEAVIPVDLSTGSGGPRLVDRPLRVEIRADELPLHALPAFTDQVETVEGQIQIDLAVRGRLDAPVVTGDVFLDLESLYVVPLGVQFGPIIGRAHTVDGVLWIDSLIAWSEGPARITGTVDFPSLTRPAFDLDVEARETWIINTADANLQVDANLAVSGPLDGLAVSGVMRTRRGIIRIPESSEFGPVTVVNLDDPAIVERVDKALMEQREQVREPSPLAENLELDVEVEIDRDVWLRSTEANIEIYTPPEVGPLRIRAQGLLALPTVEGVINTDRGEYEYLSRRFTLTRGAVTFLGEEELDPILQVAAEHQVRLPGREALTIRIVLGGTLRHLEINLESNAQPPISQSDLLSFLAFGRETAGLFQAQGSSISGQATSGGGLVGNVAGLATQQFTAVALDAMLTGVEADLGEGLGLDVMRITPAYLPAGIFTSSYLDVLRGTEIEAGKYLESRIFVGAQLRPTMALPGLRLEYRTRRGFEWTTSYAARFVPAVPTLREPSADRIGVLGSFLFKEWRF